jgi:hypothetical protein
METTITLKSVETKTTKAGAPMWTATTNLGKMSIFDKNLAEQLFTLINKNIIVDVTTINNFKNIVKMIGMAEFAPLTPASQMSQIPQAIVQDPKVKNRTQYATMLISYAKDLAVAGKIEVKDIEAKAKELLALYEEMQEMKIM